MTQVRTFFFIAVLGFCWGTAKAAPVSRKMEAQHFVEKTGKEILEILQGSNVPKQKQEDQFRKVLQKRFDLKGIGFFALGHYRRQATKQEKIDFLKVFKDVIVESYSSQFKHYSNEYLKISNVKGPDDHGGFFVISQVIREGRKPLSVHWKAFSTKQGWRVLDLVIEGVSQSQTHRKEYSELINQRGRKVSGLIKALREQVAKYNKSSAT
jgi:phospholipid transport system substrate-binding protein